MQMPSVQYFMVERAEINKRIVLCSDVQFYSLGKYRRAAATSNDVARNDSNRRYGKMPGDSESPGLRWRARCTLGNAGRMQIRRNGVTVINLWNTVAGLILRPVVLERCWQNSGRVSIKRVSRFRMILTH